MNRTTRLALSSRSSLFFVATCALCACDPGAAIPSLPRAKAGSVPTTPPATPPSTTPGPGPDWTTVGGTTVTKTRVAEGHIAVSATSVFVSYVENTTDKNGDWIEKLVVVQATPSGWANVGGPVVQSPSIGWTRLAAEGNTPYVLVDNTHNVLLR